MPDTTVKDYKEDIIKVLEESNIVINANIFEPYVDDLAQLVQQLPKDKKNNNNEYSNKIGCTLLALYSTIDQLFKENNPRVGELKSDIENILITDTKLGETLARIVNETNRAFPTYKKIIQVCQNADKETIITSEMENKIGLFSRKILDIKKGIVGIPSAHAKQSIETETESFFSHFNNENVVKELAVNIKQFFNNKEVSNAIDLLASSRVKEIQNPQSEITTIEAAAGFKETGPLALYFASANARTLAIDLDKELGNNNIISSKNFEPDDKIQTLFSKKVLTKIQEVGKELQYLQEGRKTFVGRVKLKARDYIAIVIDAFSKLADKKMDNSKLEAAVHEFGSKMPVIKKDILPPEGKAEEFGKFVNQVLVSQQKKTEIINERK